MHCLHTTTYNNNNNNNTTTHPTVCSIVCAFIENGSVKWTFLTYSAYVPKHKMLFTDVNEQYKIRAHAYVIGWCPNTMLLLMVIAETTTTKNQLFESNWFWKLSFTYSTYFLRTHIAHASSCSSSSKSVEYPFSLFLQ